MFEYFEGNYAWSRSIGMVLNCGGAILEVDDALKLIRSSGANATDHGAEAFCRAWQGAAEKVAGLARVDEARGNLRAAGGKYARAALYYFVAERETSLGDPDRPGLYKSMLSTFARYLALRREPCERVEIPYEDGQTLPGLYVRGKGDAANKPCMVHFDGMDLNKEWIYLTGMARELAERGVSTLVVDHPGVGEALRLRGLTGIVETERAASACLEWLSAQPDVDPARIGMMAISLGGYYSMRAAAFEPRFRCAVAWGAMYDFGARMALRVQGKATERSTRHFLDRAYWMTGTSSATELLAFTRGMTLDGILGGIRCPILIAHGENDRQVPLADAKRVFDEAVNSVGKEFKVHTIAEGGSEHCSFDHISLTTDYIAHWVARTLHAPSELA